MKVERRMAKRKFPQDDELRVLVVNARTAVYDLRQNFLHQQSASGIMRRNRDG